MTAFKTNKKISVDKIEKENNSPKRTRGSRISKKLKSKGLKKFTIDGIIVWALNLKNAERKVTKYKKLN